MATINGDENDNNLQGTENEADIINGLGGNDKLFGLNGNDQLFGGEGEDTLDGGLEGDVINGGNGFDTVSYVSASQGVNVNLQINLGGGDTLFSVEHVDGSEFGDVLIGDNNGTIGNQLQGFAGADELNGFAGQDVLDGGDGQDTVLGGAGEDTVTGGAGADFLNGESGFDTVSYATSATAVNASLARTTAFVGNNEQIDAIIGFECVTGSAFGDQLSGDNDSNVLSGLKGRDEIFGSGGNDLLVGGKGRDLLAGGAGADTFDFNTVSDAAATGRIGVGDSISDFEKGLDVIDFFEIDADTGSAGNQAFSFIGNDAFSGTAGELRFQVDGVFTTVLGDVDGNGKADLQVTLLDPIQLTAGDFSL
jgi:Ca2+-binding RTX toxin-like protein